MVRVAPAPENYAVNAYRR